jgi:hypothetical protein
MIASIFFMPKSPFPIRTPRGLGMAGMRPRQLTDSAAPGPNPIAKQHCYRVAARITSAALAALEPLVDIARIPGISSGDCLKFRQ